MKSSHFFEHVGEFNQKKGRNYFAVFLYVHIYFRIINKKLDDIEYFFFQM